MIKKVLLLVVLFLFFLGISVTFAEDDYVDPEKTKSSRPICVTADGKTGTLLSAPFTKNCVTDIGDYIITIIEWSFAVISPLVVLLLIVGGWQMMMAAGNPDAIKAAQLTIQRALTGLIAIVATWGLIKIIWPS